MSASRSLKYGKVPPDVLERYVFKRLGIPDQAVVLGPSYGEDAAAIQLDDHVLVMHMDPITAAEELIGWLAVNIAANDVAVCGAKPRWLLTTILLPEYREDVLDKITEQIDRAAKQLGIAVVGGHTEVSPEIGKPIVIATAIGVTSRSKLVRTSGAKPGDAVLMTKTAGLEGTAIIATDFEEQLIARGVPMDVIDRAKRFFEKISVVPEALALTELGVSSMHDPTEGGVLGGLAEIAYASRVKLVVYEDRIPIAEETMLICQAMGLDPLKLISSGVLLATVSKDHANEALKKLKSMGIEATVIGEVREGIGLELVKADGRIEQIPRYVEDEIYRLWSSS